MQSRKAILVPDQPPPTPKFETKRFVIAPLTPSRLRVLAEILLKDARLAEASWMEDKSEQGAAQEAFLLELQCTARTTKAWGIIERARAILVGVVLARETLGGIDMEVLCASAFWNQGVADEASEPVEEWLEDHAEVQLGPAH